MENNIPDNWEAVDLGKVIKLKNGYAYKSTDYSDDGIPLIRISDINDENVQIDKCVKIPKGKINPNFYVDTNDILIAMSGATTGKFGIYKHQTSALQNQRVGKFEIIDKARVSNSFLFYLVNSLKKDIELSAYGGAQPNISSTKIESLKIPLPPFIEQQRIVEKLDALMEKVNASKERLDKIPQVLKRFRQSVLFAALNGTLTENWRKKNKIESEWEERRLDELFKIRTGITPLRSNSEYYSSGTIPWAKTGEVKNKDIFTTEEKISQKAIDETGIKVFPVNTLLVAMYGEGKTRGSVARLKIKAATNQACAALINEQMPFSTNQFVFLFLLSQYEQMRSVAVGGVRPNLNLDKVKNIVLKMPPLNEQQEIVRQVERLFAIADKIEARYNQAKAQVDKLPQSILAKAFRGELVGREKVSEL